MRLPLTIRSSSLGPTLECPGRLVAVPLVPPCPDDESSLTGTSVHYVVARRLVDDFGAKAPEGLKAPAQIALDPFAAWVVDFCLDWVRENIPADWSLMVEVPFEYEYTLPTPILVPSSEIDGPIPADHEVRGEFVVIRYVLVTSHVDVVGISPDGRHVIGGDWKSGRVGADAADNNWQAASYLTQIMQAWDVEDARFAMVQPLIDEDAGVERVSWVVRTRAKLDAMIADTCRRLALTVANRFTTNSGIYQCQYCPVNGPLCPSIRAEKEARMKAQLTKEDIERLRSGADDGTLAEFVIAGRVLGKAFKGAEDALKERVKKLGAVVAPDGSTAVLTSKGGQYKITDRKGFFGALDRLLPSPEDQVEVLKPQVKELREMMAVRLDIPKESKKGRSAKSVFKDEFLPYMEQAISETLTFR